MADFASGYNPETGESSHYWDNRKFGEVFIRSEDGQYRSDEDIRAIIYSMGGPYPSNIEWFKFIPNFKTKTVEVRFKVKDRKSDRFPIKISTGVMNNEGT